MLDFPAYFLTWTTYGTWLPGDTRGWVKEEEHEVQPANPALNSAAQSQLTEAPCTLSDYQRMIVEQTIRDHCAFRGWKLVALNCRTNHVHVILFADVTAEVVERQLKAWCSRRLNEDNATQPRRRWWTKHGWVQYVSCEAHLENTVEYVINGQ